MAKTPEEKAADKAAKEAAKAAAQENPVASKSEAKAAFSAVIDAYKKLNPAKYELKKDELQKKLDAAK